MTKAQIRKNAFLKSIPIMCSDLRGIAFPKGIAVVVVAVSYKWKHNTLISIAVGTSLYMVLLRVL